MKNKILIVVIIYLASINVSQALQVFINSPLVSTVYAGVVFAIITGYFSVKHFHLLVVRSKGKIDKLEFIVIIFFIYSIISVILFGQTNNPASIKSYSYGFYYGIVPIFLFFSLRGLLESDKTILINRVFIFNMFMLVFGIIFFFWRPEIYTQHLAKIFSEAGDLAEWQIYSRLQSYTGSTAVGTTGLISFIILPKVKMKNLLRAISYTIIIATILLSQQRSSIVLLAILILISLFKIKGHILHKLFLFLFLPAFGFLLVLYLNEKIMILNIGVIDYMLENRLQNMNVAEMFKERSGYFKGIKFFLEYPFGLGLGATLSASETAGFHINGQVVDANYMRILADLGFPGLAIFMSLLINAIKKAYNKNKEILLIILVFSLQALGTNVFDTYYSIHLFWIFLALL